MSDRIIRFKICPICKQEYQCPKKIGLKNWSKRIYCSRECKARNIPKGENAYAWKDKVSYAGIHRWVYRELGLPNQCDFCKTTISKKFEWANLSGEYKRDLSDWARLCVVCHRNYDQPWIKRGRDSLGRFA